MKKHITLILFSSVIAMLLCGCTPQDNSASDNSSTAKAESSSSVPAASENNNSAGNDSKTEESGSNDNTASSQADTSSQSSDVSEEDDDDEGIVYDENGQITETPTKYISNTHTTVNLEDKQMIENKEELRLAFFTTKKELDDFYESNKDKYSLDKVDFKSLISDMDDGFFEIYNVFIIVQSYDKDKGIEIGDTHREEKGIILDVYKDDPQTADKTAYALNMISYDKTDVSKMPELNVQKAGGLYSEESDDDVIVSYGDDDEESVDDGPLYIIDEDDNVHIVEEDSSV